MIPCLPRGAALPMPHPAIPREQQIGEPIVGKAGDLTKNRQAQEPPKPGLAGRCQPNRDRAVGADRKPALGVNRVQAPAHIVHIGAVACERVGLKIDVAEIDQTGPDRLNKPTALPRDAGITDRAFGIVPDRKFRTRRHRCHGVLSKL
jgi:hypothetical protein